VVEHPSTDKTDQAKEQKETRDVNSIKMLMENLKASYQSDPQIIYPPVM
jgi:hypothetical protein